MELPRTRNGCMCETGVGITFFSRSGFPFLPPERRILFCCRSSVVTEFPKACVMMHLLFDLRLQHAHCDTCNAFCKNGHCAQVRERCVEEKQKNGNNFRIRIFRQECSIWKDDAKKVYDVKLLYEMLVTTIYSTE